MKLDRLEALVTQAGLPVGETVALFAAMLSIPTDGRYPPLALKAQRQKERTLELFAAGARQLVPGRNRSCFSLKTCTGATPRAGSAPSVSSIVFRTHGCSMVLHLSTRI